MEAISIGDKDLVKKLNDWCQEWLNNEGWKRLQANARQSSYVRGSVTKTKEPKGRERKRTLQIEESVAVDLKFYAKSHNVPLSEALRKLLDEEQGRLGVCALGIS